MPNKRRKVESNLDQMSLFDLLRIEQGAREATPTPGSLDVDLKLREALSTAIKKSNLSRWQIAAGMGEGLNENISKYQIDAWTCVSKSDRYRISATRLAAFCAVVENWEPLSVLADVAGVFIVPGCEALRGEIQRLTENIRDLQKEKKARELFLKQLGGKQ